MSELELLRRLAIALAIGLLIGLERGWQARDDSDGDRTAGVRTFALTALLGGLSAVLALASSPLVLAAALLAYSGGLVAFGYLEAKQEKNFSLAAVVAGILTFVLGAYGVVGNEMVAVAAAVAMAILLALRDRLHAWIRAVTWVEMRSVLTLLAMSFLLLPILPNRPVDPWGVLNPAEIWFFAILIAAISFAGYVAVRLFGETRGLVVAAIAGGVTSSTATTVSFARLARESPGGARLLAAGVLLSGSTMFLRVLALLAVLRPSLVAPTAASLLAGLAVLLVGAAALLLGPAAPGQRPSLTLRNPFDLGTVLWLAALIGAITLAANGLSGRLGASGAVLLAAVSGVADVDALTLSMIRLAGGTVSADNAALAIVVAAAVNTIAKSAIAMTVGRGSFGLTVVGVGLAAVGAMIAAQLLLPPLG